MSNVIVKCFLVYQNYDFQKFKMKHPKLQAYGLIKYWLFLILVINCQMEKAKTKKFSISNQDFRDSLYRLLVKSVYQKNNFLISKSKLMLWVLKTTVSVRR